jgi:alpha-tubulin suppressor-like RCC1 family protein
VGSTGVCALSFAGAPYCWGIGRNGALGTGDTLPRNVPTAVSGGLTFSAISSALVHACGLTPTGAAYCWGSNFYGATGSSVGTAALVPSLVTGGVTFQSIAAGAVLTCGVDTQSRGYCWGSNILGSLGNGATSGPISIAPTAIAGGISFASVVPGVGNNFFDTTCGLTHDGTAYCWGPNNLGQLGTTAQLSGTCTFNSAPVPCTGTPVPVATTLKFKAIAGGSGQKCAISTVHTVLCWGDNSFGQVGDGTTTNRSTPVVVPGIRVP